MAARPSRLRSSVARPAEMTAWSLAARARGERVAFVPTMGALHEGHVKLLREARRRGDGWRCRSSSTRRSSARTRISRATRAISTGDLAKAAAAGTDVAFVPEARDVYPAGFQTTVEVARARSAGCAAPFRPGHFAGVATVVCKLFNVVRPDVAVFGEKDYQQLAIMRRMVTDLDMGIEIVGIPTVRESDGLAMSSRNAYLSPAERARARVAVARRCSRRATRPPAVCATVSVWSRRRARRWTSIASTTSSSSTPTRCRLSPTSAGRPCSRWRRSSAGRV